MAFLLGGANSATGYNIENSCRWGTADEYMTLNPGTSSDVKTCTLSFWAKLGVPDGNGTDYFFSNHIDADNRVRVHISNTANFAVFGKLSGSTYIDVYSSVKYRDTSAWYNFMVILDSTDSTAADRAQLWVNGARVTALVTTDTPQPDADADVRLGTSDNMTIGAGHSGSAANSNPYDGYLSEIHFIDGQKKAATDFGEFDEDSGIWKPKKYIGTYGNNGFFMEFKGTGTSADSSGIGADTSGNDNHFAVTNLAATDITTDTPTNNFCTLNPLDVNVGIVPTFAEGNTKFTVNSSANSGNNHSRTDATIRPSSGKWYAEFTFLSGYSTADGTTQVGIISGNAQRFATNNDGYDQDNGNDSEAIGYTSVGTVKNHGTDVLTSLTTFTTDDIMGIALDLDNDKFFVSKNGTFFTNGTGTQDPPNGTNPLFSGGVITSHKVHGFQIGAKGYGSAANVIAANFGNPHTSISSGNADGAGYGNFEHAVHSGFFAVCSKNLAEYG